MNKFLTVSGMPEFFESYESLSHITTPGIVNLIGKSVLFFSLLLCEVLKQK